MVDQGLRGMSCNERALDPGWLVEMTLDRRWGGDMKISDLIVESDSEARHCQNQVFLVHTVVWSYRQNWCRAGQTWLRQQGNCCTQV
jgi:hypothetical protein